MNLGEQAECAGVAAAILARSLLMQMSRVGWGKEMMLGAHPKNWACLPPDTFPDTVLRHVFLILIYFSASASSG